ncbi:MAG TPA: amidohydrolase family protein [Allosphingosinicella sp.]|nr:amidohydrolase family protein [Allosphingosinicella sp.]
MRSLAVAAAALLALAVAAPAAPAREGAILIRGARIFDGTGAPATVGNVLIRGDRIVAVGRTVRGPRGSRNVDARGLTLIPGLHDLHTHLRAPAFDAPDDLPKAYAGYLVNGVTSVNEFSLSPEMLAPVREMTAPGRVAAPNLRLAVRLGVPGGHGTEYGWGRQFTLEAATPRAAKQAMARALPYRPDVIKVFADGWRYGRSPSLNTMSQPTLAAIVEDAHSAGIPVITHTVTLEGAKVAAAAGVDALGHGIGDALVDDALIALMKANRTAYVPTLVVYEPQEGRAFLPAEWRKLRPPERAREEARAAAAAGSPPPPESARWTIMKENVRRLKAAGVRIGVGTDAGIGGVYHGSATLREIGWLARLGFTPAEALAAATSVSAGILRQSGDHGRIAAGQRADLVLTGGRPDERIADLHDVRRVFVGGREMPLKRLAERLAEDSPSPLPVHRMPGPIYTGARSDGRTDLDTLPVEGTDPGMDHSHLDLTRLPGGRLFLTAGLGAAPAPFAELHLPLTRGAVHLADASGFAGIAFEARGAGDYALLLNSYGIQPRDWFRASFAAGEAPREIRISFSAFNSPRTEARLDPARLRALLFRLEGEPGAGAWLELGNVRFYREP